MDNNCIINCKKLTISTNGTTAGTDVLVDGVKISHVVSLFFEADAKDNSVVATVETTDEQQTENVCVFKFATEGANQ